MTPIIVDLSFFVERARSALQQQAETEKETKKKYEPHPIYK